MTAKEEQEISFLATAQPNVMFSTETGDERRTGFSSVNVLVQF